MCASRIVLLGAIALFLAGCEPKKYPAGKDTVEQFGDGSWQIGKTGGGPNHPREIHLFHHDGGQIVQNIHDWHRRGDWLYLIGANGVYVVVNYRTDEMNRFKTPEEAREPHQDELRKLRSK